MNDEGKLGTGVCEILQYTRTKQSNTWLLRKENLPEGQGPATEHWPFFALVSYSISYGVAMISRILKIKVSVAEYSLFYSYRALLQKRPICVRSLLTVATS